jgi:hypothetical protein
MVWFSVKKTQEQLYILCYYSRPGIVQDSNQNTAHASVFSIITSLIFLVSEVYHHGIFSGFMHILRAGVWG